MRKGLKIVGAVGEGGAVEIHAALAQFDHDVALLGCAFEHHVLQQMRHAGFAIVFMAAAYQVGDVDGGGGLGGVWRQQDPQAVGQAVFGDALNRAELGGYWFSSCDKTQRRKGHQ